MSTTKIVVNLGSGGESETVRGRIHIVTVLAEDHFLPDVNGFRGILPEVMGGDWLDFARSQLPPLFLDRLRPIYWYEVVLYIDEPHLQPQHPWRFSRLR